MNIFRNENIRGIDLDYSDDINRRRHNRLNVKWNVEGVWHDKSNFTTRTINVSKSGLLMQTSKESKKGEKAYIKLDTYTFGKHRIIDAVVEVKHSTISDNKFNCGALFIKLSAKNRQFLETVVSGKNPHLATDDTSENDIFI